MVSPVLITFSKVALTGQLSDHEVQTGHFVKDVFSMRQVRFLSYRV